MANLPAMKNRRWAWVMIFLAMTSLLVLRNRDYFNRKDRSSEQQANKKNSSEERDLVPERAKKNPDPASEPRGLDRNTSRIIFTKHAKCRMDCRKIDISEVEEILTAGTINYQKSDLRSKPDPKYALEGMSHDGQHLRIVFANSPRGPVVVTVIDLEKEWNCHCK